MTFKSQGQIASSWRRQFRLLCHHASVDGKVQSRAGREARLAVDLLAQNVTRNLCACAGRGPGARAEERVSGLQEELGIDRSSPCPLK